MKLNEYYRLLNKVAHISCRSRSTSSTLDPEKVAEEGIEAFEDLENRVEKQVIT